MTLSKYLKYAFKTEFSWPLEISYKISFIKLQLKDKAIENTIIM